MSEKYRPPAGPDSNPETKSHTKEYVPPVGAGSKSVKPSGDFRELPVGLLPEITQVKDK